METENNIANIQTDKNIADTASSLSMIFNPEVMKQVNFIAEIMAEGKATIPKHLQGCKSDCVAIVLQSAQWGMSPYSVAQKTHLINGTLGYEAQLVNAVVSSSKVIKGRFKYEYDGDWNNTGKGSNACIRVGAKISGDTDLTWIEWLFVGDVTTKNSPLWKTAPKQQAGYLAVKYWARLYCPEVILGVYSKEEFEQEEEKEINPQVPKTDAEKETVINQPTLESVKNKILAAKVMLELNATDLVDDLKNLPESEIKEAQNEWTKRRGELKEEFIKKNPEVSEEIDVGKQIKSCKSSEELTELIKTISDHDQMNFGGVIDQKYDSFTENRK